jgi:hypothetical protein
MILVVQKNEQKNDKDICHHVYFLIVNKTLCIKNERFSLGNLRD